MNVNQVQKLIKWKENDVSEEIEHNNKYWCKNKKTNTTLGKGNLKLKKYIQIKTSPNTRNHEEKTLK